ncbi:MAG: tetratricopeptide repeat protein [Clostridiales bacterium]|jgi:pentatricopeptide repeat protein|nr:tetratricopeptide repeat protein [Clostridiales bacterium]
MDRIDISSDIFKNTNMNSTRLIIRRCYKNNSKLLFYYLALSYCKEKNYDKAIGYFKSSLNEGLSNYLIYYNLGVAYLESSDFAKAEIFLKKSIELNNEYEKSYINLAFVYYKTGDIKKAYRTVKLGTIYNKNPELRRIEKKLLEVM